MHFISVITLLQLQKRQDISQNEKNALQVWTERFIELQPDNPHSVVIKLLKNSQGAMVAELITKMQEEYDEQNNPERLSSHFGELVDLLYNQPEINGEILGECIKRVHDAAFQRLPITQMFLEGIGRLYVLLEEIPRRKQETVGLYWKTQALLCERLKNAAHSSDDTERLATMQAIADLRQMVSDIRWLDDIHLSADVCKDNLPNTHHFVRSPATLVAWNNLSQSESQILQFLLIRAKQEQSVLSSNQYSTSTAKVPKIFGKVNKISIGEWVTPTGVHVDSIPRTLEEAKALRYVMKGKNSLNPCFFHTMSQLPVTEEAEIVFIGLYVEGLALGVLDKAKEFASSDDHATHSHISSSSEPDKHIHISSVQDVPTVISQARDVTIETIVQHYYSGQQEISSTKFKKKEIELTEEEYEKSYTEKQKRPDCNISNPILYINNEVSFYKIPARELFIISGLYQEHNQIKLPGKAKTAYVFVVRSLLASTSKKAIENDRTISCEQVLKNYFEVNAREFFFYVNKIENTWTAISLDELKINKLIKALNLQEIYINADDRAHCLSQNLSPIQLQSIAKITGHAPIDTLICNIAFKKNYFFTGREKELNELIHKFRFEEIKIFRQIIAGIPGIGKSWLAREYVRRSKEKYQLIWWVNCSTLQELEKSYLRLAQRIEEEKKLLVSHYPIEGPTVTEKQSPELLREWVKRKLAQLDSWLLIYDNVNDEDRKSLELYLPDPPNILASGYHHILITSPANNWNIEQMDTLVLCSFTPEESVRCLHHWIKSPMNIPFSNEEYKLAYTLSNNLLMCFPLALAQAGAYIRQYKYTLANYIKLYEEKRKDLILLKDSDFLSRYSDYETPLVVTWNLCLKKVAAKSPKAKLLLNYCSYLASKNIPEQLLRNLEGLNTLDDLDWTRLLDQLSKYSLISRMQMDDKFFINILPLFQEVIRNEISSDIFAEKLGVFLGRIIVIFAIILVLNYFLNRDSMAGLLHATIGCIISVTANIKQVHQFVTQNFNSAIFIIYIAQGLYFIKNNYSLEYALITFLIHYLHGSENTQKPINQLILGLNNFNKENPSYFLGDQIQTVVKYLPTLMLTSELEPYFELIGNLIEYYIERGQALDTSLNSAKIALNECDLLSTTASKNKFKTIFNLHLGKIYFKTHDLNSAEIYTKHALLLSKKIRNDSGHSLTIKSLLNLILIYMATWKNIPNIQACLIEASTLLKENPDQNLKITLCELSATFYLRMRNIEKSEKFFNKARALIDRRDCHALNYHMENVEIIKYLFSRNRDSHQLSLFHQHETNFPNFLHDMLNKHCEVHDDPRMLHSINYTITLEYIRRNDLINAKSNAEKMLKSNEEFFGKYCYYVAHTLVLLVNITHALNQNDEKKRYYNRLDKLLAKNSLLFLQHENILIVLVALCLQVNDLSTAKIVLNKAKVKLDESNSRENEEEFNGVYSMINLCLSIYYQLKGKFIKSTEILERTLTFLEEKPDEDIIDAILDRLSVNYRVLGVANPNGKGKDNEKLCLRKILATNKKRWGHFHPCTADCYFLLGQFYLLNNELSKSKIKLKQAFDIYEKRKVITHMSVETALQLNYCYLLSNDASSSINCLQQFLTMLEGYSRSNPEQTREAISAVDEAIMFHQKLDIDCLKCVMCYNEIQQRIFDLSIRRFESVRKTRVAQLTQQGQECLSEEKKEKMVKNNESHTHCNLRSNLYAIHPGFFNQPTSISVLNKQKQHLGKLIKKYQLKNMSQNELEKGLRKAALNNYQDDLQSFIHEVKNINAAGPISGDTALHYAIRKKNKICITLLLKAGAQWKENVNKKGESIVDMIKNDPEIKSLFIMDQPGVSLNHFGT